MRIISNFRHGGFGKVQLAEDDSGKRVVLKTFDPSSEIVKASSRDKLLKRFIREVKIQSKLPQDCFMPILYSDVTIDPPWFTMPEADSDFEQEIITYRASGTVPKEALSEIINALEKLHSLGYTHRDLKPSNILLHNSRWKLADFGLISSLTGTTTTLTSDNSAWGSAMYCAPEQSIDFKHVTQAADIYSFGCILHDIFTDGTRVPFQQHTCTGPVGPVIEKCTENEPSKRFKTISAVRDALFKVIVNPAAYAASTDAKTWASELQHIDSWDQQKIDDFIRFLGRQAQADDKTLILTQVDVDVLEKSRALNDDLWRALAYAYCEWCYGGFDFQYCDVLVTRLRYIYDFGEMDIQAWAIMSTAELGSSHNRWHVMRYFCKMCSPDMADDLATRIAIEILAQDAQYNFRRCAEGIGLTISAYHPKIAEVLK